MIPYDIARSPFAARTVYAGNNIGEQYGWEVGTSSRKKLIKFEK